MEERNSTAEYGAKWMTKIGVRKREKDLSEKKICKKGWKEEVEGLTGGITSGDRKGKQQEEKPVWEIKSSRRERHP